MVRDGLGCASTDGAGDQRACVAFGNEVTYPRLVQTTPNVLLLEGDLPGGATLAVGTPLRIGLPGSSHLSEARLAATAEGGRYLVSLGTRAVRGAARVAVDLPAVVRSSGAGRVSTRMVDLSSSGARLCGIRLPVGSELEVSFVPPGRHYPVTMRCVVVRAVDEDGRGAIGVTFSGSSLSFSVELTARRTHRPN